MNIWRWFLGLAAIFLVLSLVACPAPGGDSADDGSKTPTAGEERTEITGSVSFDLRYVPKGTFVMGEDVETTPVVVTLTKGCWMAETEVTYELWYEVYTWATTLPVANRYTFANPGREGNGGVIGAAHTMGNTEPVTTINWRDAMLWCNALSEKQGLTPVYYTNDTQTTVIRSVNNNSPMALANGDIGDNCVKWTADGYRLPTGAEWEYASRYRGGSDWTPGNYASGAAANYGDAGATGLVAWYSANSGTPGSTHPVGQKKANALGVNDMSGNVSEWCWDWSNFEWYAAHGGGPFSDPHGPPPPAVPPGPNFASRLGRGGNWGGGAGDLQCALHPGLVFEYFLANVYIGFRPVRNE